MTGHDEILAELERLARAVAELRARINGSAPRLVFEPDGGTSITRVAVPKPTREPDAFAKFWDTYPRKIGKGAARRQWEHAVRDYARGKGITDYRQAEHKLLWEIDRALE